jgi:hypothetical protein
VSEAILYICTLIWKPGTTAEQLHAFSAWLDTLQDEIPVLLEYRHGPDLTLEDGNADYGVVALLRSEEEVAVYLAHPAHASRLADLVDPILASRQTVQIRISP